MSFLRTALPTYLIAAVMLLAGGWVLALAVDPAWLFGLPRAGAGATEDDHPAHDDEHEGHVHLSRSAYKNLNLRIRPVKLVDGFHTLQMPGEIVEKPGHSDHALAAPVNGVVTEVYAIPGQAIRPGEALFRLQVIDEPLATAQLNLLNTIASMEVTNSELKRVGPLADAGTITGRKKLELEYELKQLQLKRELYRQELEVRGLEPEQVDVIIDQRKLIRELTVFMPKEIDHNPTPPSEEPTPGDADPIQPVSTPTVKDAWEYTIEELKVFPGKSVQRGDDLCHIAYHTVLYIEGQAFENELDYILALGQDDRQDWTVTAEFGAHQDAAKLTGLRLHHIDNHVDPQTQTYSYYLPITNEVTRDTVDEAGRRFRTWRYKPGQRVHLRVPMGDYQKKIRLPPGAVATEGASSYVFREVIAKGEDAHAHDAEADDHGHSHAGASHAAHEDVFIDLERVPVHIEFQTSEYILLAADGQLQPGDHIAMNNAYRLYLEQKSQASGGAVDHGHEH